MSATLPFAAPSLGGRFRLLRRLGAGGMGEVWAAEQLSTGAEVAVKLLPREAAADGEAAARFEVEARTLFRVHHENVVRVIDFGRDPERGWFLATELLAGEPLAARLARDPVLPPAQVVRLGLEMLAGLQAVHEAGVVHRDLKPENVMLVPGADGSVSVRLLDFGIAKLLDPAHRVDLTVAGQVFGTPAYLSPEQALGRGVDPRSDLYACGVILYRALTGRLPFEAETPTALALLHAAEPLPPLPATLPGVLRVVVEQALEKDPESRFADAAEMRAALAAAWPESEPLRLQTPAQAPRPVGTGAVPRLGGGVSRTLLTVRLSLPADFDARPTERFPVSEPRALRLTPPLVCRDVVDAFEGRIAWISNEGLLAEFGSPTDTLQCAAAVHDRLTELAPAHGYAVDARVAVTAGEVSRTGRALHGEAVTHGALLVQAAMAGEIVFTHGVYLAMTRSEVPCEAWPGRDPGVGQKLYRLCEPPDGPRPELPYGGFTLDRTRTRSARQVAVEAGRIAGAGAQLALRAGLALPPAVLKVAQRDIPKRTGWILAIVLGLAVGGGAATALVPRGPSSQVEAALREGRAADARRLADDWAGQAPRDPEAQAFRGRALAAEGKLAEAHEVLAAALAADPALARVDGVAKAVVRAMDRPDADRSLVLQHRSAALDRALLEATRSIRYWERWHAARALERLGLGPRIDWVEVYLLDLQHAGSCGTRVRAARKLAELGDGRAIPVLEQVRGTKMPEWACNLDETIDESVALLRRQGR